MAKQYGTRVDAPIVAGNDDTDDIASMLGWQAQGGFQRFESIVERDKFSNDFKSRVYKTTAYVENVGWFKWDGIRVDGGDGKWEPTNQPSLGITFVNPDGSTTSGIQMFALDGLVLKGNNKDGFTLALAKGSANKGMTFSEFNNAMYGGAEITDVIVEEPLEVYEDPNVENGIRMRIKHGYYELAKPPGYLAYYDTPITVVGNHNKVDKYHRGRIWPNYIVVQGGAFIEVKPQDKVIGLQEADALDPNISGGMDYFLGSFQTIDGNAPEDGFIESIIYDTRTQQIAEDKDGNLLAVRRNYKKGQPLAPKHDPLIACGVINAKGLTEYGCSIVHNFENDPVKILNYTDGPSGLVVQALTTEGCTGDALQQFEIDTGYKIRPVVRYFGESVWDATFAFQQDIPKTLVKAGDGMLSVTGVDLHNLTDVSLTVANEAITIESAGNGITDFYLGGHLERDICRALAGKQVTLSVDITDKDSGWYLCAYSREDDAVTPIYDARTDGVIDVEEGWLFIGSTFASEDITTEGHKVVLPFTMPAGANSVAFCLYPVTAANPTTITASNFKLDVDTPFRGVEEQDLVLSGLQHLHHAMSTTVLKQDSEGYAELRYTINQRPDGFAMPWGMSPEDIPGMHLDKTKNVIVGSSAAGGEGALVADVDLTVNVGVKLLIWNEQASTTQDTWWIVKGDVDSVETKIPESVHTFPVPPNKGTAEFYMTPINIRLFAGEYIMLRSSASIADGAFIASTSHAKPMVTTTLKVNRIV